MKFSDDQIQAIESQANLQGFMVAQAPGTIHYSSQVLQGKTTMVTKLIESLFSLARIGARGTLQGGSMSGGQSDLYFHIVDSPGAPYIVVLATNKGTDHKPILTRTLSQLAK